MQQADPFLVTLQKCMEVFMQRSMHDFLGFARERGLSMSQFGALLQIHHRECGGVSSLGDKLGVTSSAASQLLERLVQQELVLRTEDPSDRRVKQLVLTNKGHQVVKESMRARQRWLLDLAGTLSDYEKKDVAAALNLLLDKAARLSPPVQPDTYPIPEGV